MDSEQALVFVGFPVAVTALVLAGSPSIASAIGLSPAGMLGGLFLASLLLAIPRQTRPLGIAILGVGLLWLLLALVTISTIGS